MANLALAGLLWLGLLFGLRSLNSALGRPYLSGRKSVPLRRICAVSRPDWSRPLPRPLTIPEVMKLATLDDVRVLMQKHLPAEYRAKFAWRQLAAMLRRTAHGTTDCAELATALQLVLKLEGVMCR